MGFKPLTCELSDALLTTNFYKNCKIPYLVNLEICPNTKYWYWAPVTHDVNQEVTSQRKQIPVKVYYPWVST